MSRRDVAKVSGITLDEHGTYAVRVHAEDGFAFLIHERLDGFMHSPEHVRLTHEGAIALRDWLDEAVQV